MLLDELAVPPNHFVWTYVVILTLLWIFTNDLQIIG